MAAEMERSRSIKGLTVEETGEWWAGRGEVRPIRVAKKEVEDILSLPTLVDNDERPLTVRFSRFTGKIYLPPDLEYNSLEAAISQQRDILGERAEAEAAQVEQAMDWIGFLLQATPNGKLTRKSVATLAEQIAEALDSFGFSRAENDIGKLLPAHDRLARMDPLIARARFRGDYLKLVKLQVQAVLASEESTSFLGLLLMEREFSRRTIKGAMEDLETFTEMTKEREVFQGKIKGMKEVLKAITTSLASVKVLPYLPVVRKAAIILVGCREKWRDVNRGIIGDKADELFEMTPVTELISLRYFQDAEERIRELSYLPLKSVLEENLELNFNPVGFADDKA